MGMFREAGGSDGTIVEYTFTAKEWEPKQKGGDPYTTLSYDFKFLADGAEEPTDRFLNAGFIHEGVTVSEDGQTLESDREGGVIQSNTEFARFIGSLVEKGFPESSLDENGRNFAAINGTRLQLVQWVDHELMERLKKEGKNPKRKGKDGKEYNRTETRVGQVYELPSEKKGGKAAKTAAKPATKASAKPATKETPDTDRFDAVLLELLSEAKDNVIQRSAISSLVVRYHLKNKATVTTDDRETLRKALSDEAYLKDAAERGIITYNAASKKQEIGVA